PALPVSLVSTWTPSGATSAAMAAVATKNARRASLRMRCPPSGDIENKKGRCFQRPFSVRLAALLGRNRTLDLGLRSVGRGLLGLDGLVPLACHVTQPRDGAAGAGRDEAAHDDVLL